MTRAVIRPALLALTVVAAALMAAGTARPSGAPRRETGFLDRTLALNARVYRYAVYVPREAPAPGAKWPAILFLHGSGERGHEGLRPESFGLGAAIRWYPPRFPGIAVFPQAPDDSTWAGEPAAAAMAALDSAVAEFGCDPDRLYLTGLSMGGYGTWYLAYAHPGTFAAIMPVCGGIVVPPRDDEHDVIQLPATLGAADPYDAAARGVKDIPCWIFHGAKDDEVPVSEARRMHEALSRLGARVRYTEFPDLGHTCWDQAYGPDEVWNWLLSQRRGDRR